MCVSVYTYIHTPYTHTHTHIHTHTHPPTRQVIIQRAGKAPERLPCSVVVWATGNKSRPFVDTLRAAIGLDVQNNFRGLLTNDRLEVLSPPSLPLLLSISLSVVRGELSNTFHGLLTNDRVEVLRVCVCVRAHTHTQHNTRAHVHNTHTHTHTHTHERRWGWMPMACACASVCACVRVCARF